MDAASTAVPTSPATGVGCGQCGFHASCSYGVDDASDVEGIATALADETDREHRCTSGTGIEGEHHELHPCAHTTLR